MTTSVNRLKLATAPSDPGEDGAVTDFRLSAAPSPTLSALVLEHGVELTRFAYLICGDRDRADDLVQDVLLAMHRRFGNQLAIDNPQAYARRAIVNANISWSRRPGRREVPTDRIPEHPTTPEPADDGLWQLLSHLSERQRAVLVLRYYLGYPDADIAQTLGCRRATVRSLAARALTDLRGRMPAGYGGDR